MKFKTKDQKNKEQEIELWLKQEEYGDSIFLMGRDTEGTKKYIMEFKDGRFYRYISADLVSMVTNDKGEIEEDETMGR